MRPSPVHQRTSQPECAPGRAPTVRQPETCGCTGAKSGAARPCSIDHSHGTDLRDTPPKKAGYHGPTAGRIEANKPSRPPTRWARGGRSHAASHMPGLAGLPAASPEAASSRADVRRLEATGWPVHPQNCVDGYVFDRRKVAPARAPSPAPYVQARGYSGFTRLYMYTQPRRLRSGWWPDRGGEAGCTVTRSTRSGLICPRNQTASWAVTANSRSCLSCWA